MKCRKRRRHGYARPRSGGRNEDHRSNECPRRRNDGENFEENFEENFRRNFCCERKERIAGLNDLHGSGAPPDPEQWPVESKAATSTKQAMDRYR